MSVCTCEIQKKQIALDFLNSANLWTWNLLSLQDMYAAGNTLRDIREVVPFRVEACNRSVRCCGVCTRMCRSRCVQDCLHRIYMWRQMVLNTPDDRKMYIPAAIKFVAFQKFETPEDMSLVVGEILSAKTNTQLRKYLDNVKDHPYKNSYEPMCALDPLTGKRMVDPSNGAIKFLHWPTSGLCPYCLPRVTVDRRYGKRTVGDL